MTSTAHHFIMSRSTFRWPISTSTTQQIVGVYNDSSGKRHGFLDSGGTLTNIDDTLGTDTQPFGINNSAQIVGSSDDSKGIEHGFLYSGGNFTTFDVGTNGTEITGINNAGQIVGYYKDSSGVAHGFTAAPVTTTVGYTFRVGCRQRQQYLCVWDQRRRQDRWNLL